MLQKRFSLQEKGRSLLTTEKMTKCTKKKKKEKRILFRLHQLQLTVLHSTVGITRWKNQRFHKVCEKYFKINCIKNYSSTPYTTGTNSTSFSKGPYLANEKAFRPENVFTVN